MSTTKPSLSEKDLEHIETWPAPDGLAELVKIY